MDYAKVEKYIVDWLRDMCSQSRTSGFVIGISGGVDSAVCSTLAAMTGLPTLCATLPIHQHQSHIDRADNHIALLKKRFANVESIDVDLTAAFGAFIGAMPGITCSEHVKQLTEANTRARLRMATLYYLSGSTGRLVVGTGNKIEDFGIGFFTKYGDGGVDISPVADLTKSEVLELARRLEINDDIIEAAPSDGLFGDDLSDEMQIGASYPELEWAMEQHEKGAGTDDFEGRQREVMEIYIRRRKANLHKMTPIPICLIPDEYR